MGFRILRNTKRDLPVPDPPARVDVHEGLSYGLFLPDGPPRGGVVILHGAGSAKESHYDYARAVRAYGLAAISFDQRGHGASGGALDGRALTDVATMAALLRSETGDAGLPVGLRGSSMGGFMAIAAARASGAQAVVAICPASGEMMLRGLRSGRFDFEADGPALSALLEITDLEQVVAEMDCPLLVLHARGDEQVPYEYSQELAAAARPDRARLIIVPGGHHRSIQHDSELQGESLRFLLGAFAPAD
jgi:pimeloyl-ACP methyl ester carboxylesterase